MKKKQKEQLAALQQAATDMAATLQTALADPQQFYRYVYAPKGAAPEEIILHKADIHAMKEMTTTLKELTAIIRNVYDLPESAGKREDAKEAKHGVIVLG